MLKEKKNIFPEGSPDDVSFSMEVLRTTAETLFHERQQTAKQRSSSKDIDNNDNNANGNSDLNNLTYSTNSVNRYINLYFNFKLFELTYFINNYQQLHILPSSYLEF